jgi:hypothetical protein
VRHKQWGFTQIISRSIIQCVARNNTLCSLYKYGSIEIDRTCVDISYSIPPLEVYQLTVKSLYIYIATPDEPDHVTILILNLASIPSVSYSQSLPSHIALVH